MALVKHDPVVEDIPDVPSMVQNDGLFLLEHILEEFIVPLVYRKSKLVYNVYLEFKQGKGSFSIL